MQTASTPKRTTVRYLLSALFVILSTLTISTLAQAPALSLADLLIGLRSKKVSLPERNQILAGAVTERGVTFTLSPQIEKELIATGAADVLLSAIRAKTAPPKPAATPTPTPVATPTPPPPDAAFYQKRADASLDKGELDSALSDFNKAAEMKKDDPSILLGRGRTFFSLKSYDKSVKDFDRVIELNPKASVAFLNRGASYEKLGDKQKALEDYKKANELDNSNVLAASEAKRIQDEIDKANPPKPVEPVRPAYVNLGLLGPEAAVRLVVPSYSSVAKQSRIEGKVTVEVDLDEEGNVTKADATDGPALLRGSAEEAARRSKFKPATFNGTPIKAKGVITYNFNL